MVNVSKVKLYHEPETPLTKPGPLRVRGGEEYEVEKILAKKTTNGEVQYLVRWKGYGKDEDMWLFANDMNHCRRLIKEFEAKQK